MVDTSAFIIWPNLKQKVIHIKYNIQTKTQPKTDDKCIIF